MTDRPGGGGAGDGGESGAVTSTGSATEMGSVTEERAVPETGAVASVGAVTSTGSASEAGSATVRPDSSNEEKKRTEVRHLRARNRKRWRTAAIVAASVVGAVALALGIFILLSHVAPDFIDSILYTPEELRIINY